MSFLDRKGDKVAESGLAVEVRNEASGWEEPPFPDDLAATLGRAAILGAKGQLIDVLTASVATLLAILLRWGYSYGYFDQTVLSVRGIALADPRALRGDWFTHSVSQPHWLFDAVTYVGERFGALPWVYLAYWFTGIVVFSVAAVWVAERFVPGRRGAAALIGPLVALAPQAILGSSGPLVWFAIPNMLGGCLAFLALAALLTGRFRIAVVGALLAGLVHVQHGANLAAVLMVAAFIPGGWTRKQRVVLAGTAVALLAGALAVAIWRQLEPTGPEWLETCENLIPYHCYAPSWHAPYLISGGLVIALAAAFIWYARDRLSAVIPAVALPTAALVVGVAAERFDWGALGRLAQTYNVHRFVTLVVPFGAAGLLIVGSRLARNQSTRVRRALAGAIGGGVVLIWSMMTEDPFSRSLIDRPSSLAVALAIGVAVWVGTSGGSPRQRGASLRAQSVVAVTAALMPAVLMAASSGTFGRVGYDSSLAGVRAALDIGRTVQEHSVIAAPPEIYWLRLISRRAVVADCKAGPYGGAAWHEYMIRLDALGGCVGSSSNFPVLAPEQVEELRSEYGATHVLLYGNDPKIGYARTHWRLVYEAPPQSYLYMHSGWLLFEMTP